MADSIFQVLPTPELEVRPWGSRWPLVWPTPLEVEVGGGVMGGYGCGVGGGVDRGFGLKVAPIAPLSVRKF